MTLSAYNYSINQKPGKARANADVLSRLPLPLVPQEVPEPGETILLFECVQVDPVSPQLIRRGTDCDPILAEVCNSVLQGWPSQLEGEEFQPYVRRQAELSVEHGCVLWVNRVVVPPSAHPQFLDLLHSTHPGIVRMKELARSYVWWPGMDAMLEDRVKGFVQCQESQKSPAKAPLHPWEWPESAMGQGAG